MSVRFSRVLGGAAVAAVIASGLGVPGSPMQVSAATATTTFTCNGIEGDVAGKVGGANKSSAELMQLLGQLGGASTLTLPVTVETNFPANVSTGVGDFNVEFNYRIALPDSLIGQVKSLLGLNSVKVKNASFGVNVTGSATKTLTANIPEMRVSLANTPVTISQKVNGSISPTGAGLIYYRPGSARISIEVNGSVAGQANVGTLTVQCSAAGLLGTTAVRPPGSPLIAKNPIQVSAAAGSTVSVKLKDGITPDQGNPILWDTLKVTNQATDGEAWIDADSVLTFKAPNKNGVYDVSYEVCGASRVIEGAPGVNEVQTLAFADDKYEGTRPLWFTLKFRGEETAPIVTGFYNDLLGAPVPKNTWNDDDMLLHLLFGYFAAPSAARIQQALEALPGIEPGDVTVTGGPTTGYNLPDQPYVITFGGKLGEADVEEIEIGQWNTWLPSDGLTQILEAAKGLTGGGGGDGDGAGTEPITAEQAWDNVLHNGWSFEQFLEAAGERLKWEIMQSIDIQAILDFLTSLFPKTPQVRTTTAGENAILPSDSGPLCSQGVVQVTVTGAAEVQGTNVVNTGATPQAGGAARVAGRVSYAG